MNNDAISDFYMALIMHLNAKYHLSTEEMAEANRIGYELVFQDYGRDVADLAFQKGSYTEDGEKVEESN